MLAAGAGRGAVNSSAAAAKSEVLRGWRAFNGRTNNSILQDCAENLLLGTGFLSSSGPAGYGLHSFRQTAGVGIGRLATTP